MFSLSKTLKSAAVAAAMIAAPMTANAVTLTVDDLGTVGIDVATAGVTVANYSGAAGGFTVAIASAAINSLPGMHQLNTTSINTSGIGTLVVTAEESGLTDFGAPLIGLDGTASISDVSSMISVAHYIDTGGGFTLSGSALDFLAAGGNNQSDATSGVAAPAGPFALRTIITITTLASDQTANVNATLVAAVPVPAAGLMLLTALGGLGIARRRRKAA